MYDEVSEDILAGVFLELGNSVCEATTGCCICCLEKGICYFAHRVWKKCMLPMLATLEGGEQDSKPGNVLFLCTQQTTRSTLMTRCN